MGAGTNSSRRRFLAAAGAAGAAAGIGATLWRTGRRAAAPIEDAAFPYPLRLPAAEGLHGVLDASGTLVLVAKPAREALTGGRPTPLLVYEIEHGGRIYRNPVLRVRRGTPLRVRFWNALDETSIVHWHGLRIDTNNDGHPHYAVAAGQTYDYQFTVDNRAGTYWYHPHPHHLAARQAYHGLSGLMIVDDDEDARLRHALGLAFGATDIPLVIQDKRIDDAGALRYEPGGHDGIHGHLGERILVNLTPAAHLDVATRIYRLRLLNASNARVYRIAFLHGGRALDFAVIGGDGGLLAQPVAARELFLAPAERADLLLDLRAASPGDRVTLASLPFDAMRDGSLAAAAPVPCAPLGLLLMRVMRHERPDASLPRALSATAPVSVPDAPTRRFALEFRGGAWRINGAVYGMAQIAFAVKRDAPETWEFESAGAAMPHPLHVHGYQFRVLQRRGTPAHLAPAYPAGLAPHESGWKDTVLLWPGETLRIAMDFAHPFPGDQVYMLQCHNLEHESHGMMVNFRVAA